MKNSQKMLKNRKNAIFHVFRSKSVGKSMGYEVWNGLYCHKMHMNYAIFPIVHVHFMTMTSKNSDLLHMSHFKKYLDFYDIKCRVKNELSAGIYRIADFRFLKQSINSNENFNSLQDLRMSYLDHTNLRQFVSNFKNYIISRINGKAEAVHTHGNITNDGRIGTDYDVPLSTNYGGFVGPGEWMSLGTIKNMTENPYDDVIQIDASDMEPNTQIYVYEVGGETSMPGYSLLMIGNSTGLFYISKTDSNEFIFTVGNKQTDTINYHNTYDSGNNLIPGISTAGGHLIKIFENSNTFTIME